MIFIKLYILNKYHKNIEIPIITEDTILLILKTVSQQSLCGRKVGAVNKAQYDDILKFYDDEYAPLIAEPKTSSVNTSQIFTYIATMYVTNLETNIKMHFLNHLYGFVNKMWKNYVDNEIQKIEKSKQYIKKQQLRAELKKVKDDIINNTTNSDVKYHNWIKLHRPKLLPDVLNRTYQDDIDENPQKYIKYMIYM